MQKKKLKYGLLIIFILLLSVDFIAAQTEKQIFNTQELEWLKKHPVIKVGGAPDFPPFEFFDKTGKYVGITADYFKEVEKLMGIKFDFVQSKTWTEVLEKAKRKEIDIVPSAAYSASRGEYMLFTGPCFSFPGVILTSDEKEDINTIENLHGKKVAIVKEYIWETYVSINHPEIIIIPVSSGKEGVRQLSLGNVDAMIAYLPSAQYFIHQEKISNIKVAGEIDFMSELAIMSRNDWPVLNRILEKCVSHISEETKDEIISNWIKIDDYSFFKSKETMYVVLIISIQILFVLSIIYLVFYNNKKILRLFSKEKPVNYKSLIYIITIFFVLNAVIFLDEIIDLPNLIFKTPKSQSNFPEAIFESVLLYIIGIFTVLFIYRSIKQKYKAENLLVQSEEKYKLLVDNQSDLLVKVDKEGRFLFVSPSYCNVFGKTEEELLNKTFMPLIHRKDLENTLKGMEALYKPPYTCYIEQRAKTVDGWRWFGWTDIAILNDKQEVIEIIGSGRDITELKGVEIELRKHQEHLEKLVKKRTSELEQKNKDLEDFNNLFIDREFRIKELKDKIIELEKNR